jgi:hypothetical protein
LFYKERAQRSSAALSIFIIGRTFLFSRTNFPMRQITLNLIRNGLFPNQRVFTHQNFRDKSFCLPFALLSASVSNFFAKMNGISQRYLRKCACPFSGIVFFRLLPKREMAVQQKVARIFPSKSARFYEAQESLGQMLKMFHEKCGRNFRASIAAA